MGDPSLFLRGFNITNRWLGLLSFSWGSSESWNSLWLSFRYILYIYILYIHIVYIYTHFFDVPCLMYSSLLSHVQMEHMRKEDDKFVAGLCLCIMYTWGRKTWNNKFVSSLLPFVSCTGGTHEEGRHDMTCLRSFVFCLMYRSNIWGRKAWHDLSPVFCLLSHVQI